MGSHLREADENGNMGKPMSLRLPHASFDVFDAFGASETSEAFGAFKASHFDSIYLRAASSIASAFSNASGRSSAKDRKSVV